MLTTEFEKILVPTDFSACSGEATRVAADLAQRFDADLTIVHAHDLLAYALPDGFELLDPSERERLLESLQLHLTRAQRQALEAGAPRVETRLIHGSVAREVVELARDGGFDLIVMGTHGRTGVQHFMIGSVAERIVRLAPCAVLTVKARQRRSTG